MKQRIAAPAVVLLLGVLCPGRPARAQDAPESITTQELSGLFKTFKSDSAEERWKAAQAVLDLDKGSIPALRKRLLRDFKASGESMKRILYALRKDLKEEKIKELQAKGKPFKEDDVETMSPEAFLKILVERRRDDNILAWRAAAEIMTLLTALTLMETRASLLIVLDFSSAHEYAFRKEIYQLMLWTGEKALPAMVLRKNSKDADVQTVISAYLEKMNMARAGQQVQVKDPAVLAEILVLFGETKNFESIDAIISFLNAENPVIRKAAREAILKFGKSSQWALRKAYKQYTEAEPDAAWPAEKIAEELFRAQDNDRMAPLNEKMNEALDLAKAGKFDEMETRFKEILALQPMYGRKQEMVPGYVAAARQALDGNDLDRASFLLRVVRRINTDPAQEKKIQAMLFYAEALRDLGEGIADPALMKKAVQLDPGFKEARERLEDIEKVYRGRRIRGYRILAAGGIGTTALLILLLILLKRW